MTRGQHDNGMKAVARVRGVREQDSRLGLRQAADDEREAERRVDAVVDRLQQAGATDGAVAAYLLARTTGLALAQDAAVAREAAATARTVTTAAREHWQRDRTRLEAVELLLARRVEARRVEAARREVVEVDDLVAGQWLRARGGSAG